MASYTMFFVLMSCLLGALQLVLGVAVGIWVRRPDRAAFERQKNDLEQAGAIAKRLQTMASEMSSIVGEHRTELEQATQLLANDAVKGDQAIADLVSKVIDEIVNSNKSLQAKLDTAEGRLQVQSVEIEAHISRSLTDPLTGLPNRRDFNERLEERMSAWSRRSEIFSLLMIDVDHFKKLNDQYGHLAGDQVLAAIGGALQGAIRRDDAVARFGGEEFAILLPSTRLEPAAQVAQKVREAVERTVITHNDHQISATISMGIAMIEQNETVEMLIQRADAALYAAKAAGRNCSFAHDGVDCHLADGSTSVRQQSVNKRLANLLQEPDETESSDAAGGEATMDLGAYLPSDGISASLSETCQELRRFLAQRGALNDAAEKSQPTIKP